MQKNIEIFSHAKERREESRCNPDIARRGAEVAAALREIIILCGLGEMVFSNAGEENLSGDAWELGLTILYCTSTAWPRLPP